MFTMQHFKSLSLSDLIRDPDSVVEDFNEISDNDDIEYVKEYGIGIDCHLRFIEVSIRYRNGSVIQKAQARFSTEWKSLVEARDWCIQILTTKADPMPNLSEPLHYLVESTANYHMPVCMAFGGTPTIINPTLAGATKRKTDVLDSRLLALHDQINIWRECYIPSEDVKTLRVMISQRDRCIHDATVEGRLEEGRGGLGNTVLQFEEAIAHAQFGSNESQRIACSLGCKSRRTRQTGVDLDDAIVF